MKIRVASPDDVPALFEVRTSVRENHLSMEQMARLGITPETLPGMLTGQGRGWVAEIDGRVVAFSMADVAKATVFAMFVHPDYEGRGLGRALMEEAEEWLFARGCDEIWLLTGSDPTIRANQFYPRLGWRNVGIQEDGQIKYVKRRDEASHP